MIFTKHLKYLLLGGLLIIPLFLYMDNMAIRTWDEARNTINAYEMYRNGGFFVTYFEGEPDMWNTKPPLLIWIQALFMHLFGPNEFAIRLPSALASLATCILLVVFFEKYLKRFWFGAITVLILITCNGYIGVHVARTGDYDAILTLFLLFSGLFFFSFIETKKIKHLYLFFIFLTLGCLTKGIAGLLFAPAYMLYAIYRKKFLKLLKNKHLYFGILGFVLIIGGYYLIREALNPGYLQAIADNELGGRYVRVMGNHKKGFFYYLNSMINRDFRGLAFLIPLGAVIGLLSKNSKILKITVFSLIMAGVHFLVISMATNKLQWYNVPEFPWLAIIMTTAIFTGFEYLRDIDKKKLPITVNILPYALIILLFFQPYVHITNKVMGHNRPFAKWQRSMEIGYYLRGATKGYYDVDGFDLLTHGYNTQNLLYVKVLQDKGVDIEVKDWQNLEPNDKVLVHQPEMMECINEFYDYEILSKARNVYKLKIYGNRKIENRSVGSSTDIQ